MKFTVYGRTPKSKMTSNGSGLIIELLRSSVWVVRVACDSRSGRWVQRAGTVSLPQPRVANGVPERFPYVTVSLLRGFPERCSRLCTFDSYGVGVCGAVGVCVRACVCVCVCVCVGRGG